MVMTVQMDHTALSVKTMQELKYDLFNDDQKKDK
jgi:hypothetical protein